MDVTTKENLKKALIYVKDGDYRYRKVFFMKAITEMICFMEKE
jgi:hypothetical protein